MGLETMTAQNRAATPEILELLSELEHRDKDSKGHIQAGSEAGAGLHDLRKYRVVNATGHEVGEVKDMYVEPHTRHAHFALLSLGNHALGVGDRHVLVAFDDMEIVGDKQVEVSKAVD